MLLAWKRIPAKGKQNHSESVKVLSFTEWFVRSERVSESWQFHSRPAAMLAAELNWTEKGTNQFMKWFRSVRSLKRFVHSTDTTLQLAELAADLAAELVAELAAELAEFLLFVVDSTCLQSHFSLYLYYEFPLVGSPLLSSVHKFWLWRRHSASMRGLSSW